MRPMEAARSISAMAGWSATPAIQIWLPPVRRFAHDRALFAVSSARDDFVLAAGQCPGTADGPGPSSSSSDDRECSGADAYPDAATASHAAFVGAVWRIPSEHGARTHVDELEAAGSAHSRRQAVHLADRRDFAGHREQS